MKYRITLEVEETTEEMAHQLVAVAIKKDDFIKSETKIAFEKIQKVVDENLVDKPTRKIKL